MIRRGSWAVSALPCSRIPWGVKSALSPSPRSQAADPGGDLAFGISQGAQTIPASEEVGATARGGPRQGEQRPWLGGSLIGILESAPSALYSEVGLGGTSREVEMEG